MVACGLHPPTSPDDEDIEVSEDDDEEEGELDSTGGLFIALITSEVPPEESSTDNRALFF